MTDVLNSAANGVSGSTEPDEATAVFRVDVDGIVREWSDAIEKLTGYPRDSVLGKPASGLQCPGCTIPTCPFAPHDLAALSESSARTVETCLRRNDGEIIPVYKSANPLHTPDGTLSGVEIHLNPVP